MERRGREFWRKLVRECDRGGMTVTEVARRHGVRANTLTWWRWKLRSEARATKARRRRTEEVRIVPVKLDVAVDAPAEPAPVMEAAVRGVVVRFAMGTDPSYVAALLRQLDGSC